MNQLVSIIVVTYNSSKFIEETLDSIAAQTWPELELIITDDCSTDNTLELCSKWLQQNHQRFVRTELLTVKKNSGISCNCNRGLKAAKGDWIHYCAGDDAFLPNCIIDNMQYIGKNPSIRVLFSYCRVYKDTFEEKNFLRVLPGQYPTNIISEQFTAEAQYKLLLLSDRITFTPSSFIHRETQLQVGGFNEKVKLQEDYPLWLSLTKAGYKLHFMEKETVRYRQHASATNNMNVDYFIKPNYFRTETFRREYIYPNLPWDVRWNMKFCWYGSQLFRCNALNRNKKHNHLLFNLLTVYLNPFKYYLYLKLRLVKNLKNKEFYQ